MTRGLQIDTGIVKCLFHLRSKGRSYQQIADEFGKSKSWVQHVMVAYDSSTCQLRKKKKRGVKRKTTQEEDAVIVRYGKELADSPISEVAARVNESNELQSVVSWDIVQRRLKEGGARTVTAVADEFTDEHMRNRVRFATDWQQRLLTEPRFFDTIAFSDEVRFDLSRLGRIRIRIFDGESKYDPRLQRKTATKRGGIMYLGIICRSGPVAFVRVDGTMTAFKYENLLFDHLLPFLEENRRSDFEFMQDNARVHTAKRLCAPTEEGFFYREGITVFAWPPKSPDLNPIENIWGRMKMILSKVRPQNLEELDVAVRSAWIQACTATLCESLYRSMPNRLNLVISSKGYRIPY